MKKFFILLVIVVLTIVGTACEQERGDHDNTGPVSSDDDTTIINPPANDWDADGIVNEMDNCPYHYNPGQQNSDGDPAGDACDCAPNDPTRWASTIIYQDDDNDGLPEEGGATNSICTDNNSQPPAGWTYLAGPPWDPCPNDPLNVCVATNRPPTVTGTAPAINASFTAPANITFGATATDPDPGDTVVRVDFLFGSTVMCSDTNGAPFGCTINGLNVGTYRWRARAYDTYGASSVSAEYIFYVTPSGGGLTVIITDPLSGDTFPYGTNIPIAVTATYQYGTITSVTCYDGANAIGTDITAPYTCTLTNAASGTHTLTARAVASDGNTATSTPVVITVGAQPNPVMFYVDWAYPVEGNYQSTIYTNACKVTSGDDWQAYGPFIGHEYPQNHLGCELNPDVFVTETAWLSIHVPGTNMNECQGSDGTVFWSDWYPMGAMESLYSDTVHMMCSNLPTGSPHFYLIQNGVVLDLQWRMVHLPSGFTYEINFSTGTDPGGNEVPITAGIVLDTDGDGINNALDNCIWMPNPLQEASASNPVYNAAGDRAGDACQGIDSDNDTIYDWYDNFPYDWTTY